MIRVKKKTLFRIFLSFFLIFHLSCIFLTPISGTYLSDRLAFVTVPYASFFEITSRWGFFAPDPGPPPLYIEYEAISEKGESLASGSWPARRGPNLELSKSRMDPVFQKSDENILRERFNRRVSVARFVAPSPERIEKIMGPFFCKMFPKAGSIKLWLTYEGVPSLEQITSEKKKMGEPFVISKKWIAQSLCLGRS